MYTAKHARLYKHKVHDGQAYIFYMDIRSTGKGYEEFIQQGMEEEGYHTASWTPTTASGIYFVRMEAASAADPTVAYRAARKVLYIR